MSLLKYIYIWTNLYLVQVLECDLRVDTVFKNRAYWALQWLLAPFCCSVSALLDDDDDGDDDNKESSFWAREADGPLSSLPSAAGLTSTSFESMIPVNTLIMARPDSTGPWPLTVQVSVGSRVDMIDSHCKPCRKAAFQQRKSESWRQWETRGKRESTPCILWLIKCYYPAQQEVPEK